ncbi:MAG: SDR family oxidoreductase [Candidatus Dormibacteraeota bacterium]|nr:SDR family oxidoreductase [Candidatus Dormibacteraeota bacterium]
MESWTSSADTLRGNVAMVTGANAGMGKEISLGLARMGATLVMVSRDRERGEAARAEVEQKTGNRDVGLLLADLSSQLSIRHLVQEFGARHDRLHVMVNNAGVTLSKRLETADGLETVFATNHLASFLLTNLLLPVLLASAPARVVIVSSAAHSMGKIDFADLQSARKYDEIRAYNASKLANVLFTYELARRLAGTGVTANVVEPGFVKTNLRVPFPFSLFSFMRGSVVEGARPTMFVSASDSLDGITGTFFNKKGEATRSSQLSYDEEAARRLWQVSAELTHLEENARPSRS